MKRLLLLVAAWLLGGCDMSIPKPDVDYAYTWNFNVANETDREIVLTDIFYPERQPVVIAPWQSEWITDIDLSGGEPTCVMGDIFANLQMTEKGYADMFHFTMTVDEAVVSDEVWRRENWTFEAGVHLSTYTLTVTDELLTQLAAE